MRFRRITVFLLIAALLSAVLTGCDGGGSGGDKSKTTAATGAKEPTFVSISESISEAGSQFVITFDYEKNIEASQLEVTVGGIPAEINYCRKNEATITIPNGVIAGSQSVTASVNGNECKNPLSIEIHSPVIMGVASYLSGIGIEVINIRREADTVRVFFNDNEIPYEYINPLRPQDSSVGYSDSADLYNVDLYSIMVHLSKEIKEGEVYIMYGENKSNTMAFVRE